MVLVLFVVFVVSLFSGQNALLLLAGAILHAVFRRIL